MAFLQILAFGPLTFPGVFVSGIMLGLLFGLPVASLWALLPGRRDRMKQFGSVLAASIAAAIGFMLLLYIVGP